MDPFSEAREAVLIGDVIHYNYPLRYCWSRGEGDEGRGGEMSKGTGRQGERKGRRDECVCVCVCITLTSDSLCANVSGKEPWGTESYSMWDCGQVGMKVTCINSLLPLLSSSLPSSGVPHLMMRRVSWKSLTGWCLCHMCREVPSQSWSRWTLWTDPWSPLWPSVDVGWEERQWWVWFSMTVMWGHVWM